MGDSMAKNAPLVTIVIKNTFINTDKNIIKAELNKKIEKILQKAGK